MKKTHHRSASTTKTASPLSTPRPIHATTNHTQHTAAHGACHDRDTVMTVSKEKMTARKPAIDGTRGAGK